MDDVTKHFWEATYKQNIAKMVGVCYRYTYNRQTAEDLAHEAFLVAIDKSSSFENKGSFDAWLRRVVVNVALQYIREQKRQKCHEDRVAYDTITSQSQDESQSNEENSISEAELLEAIGHLPEHHKLVFNLYVFDNFTHAQIGAELGISEGTSKSHLARARKKLKEILKDKVKENRKRSKLFLLLPGVFFNVDRFFVGQLKSLELQPQKSLLIDTVDFGSTSLPKSNLDIIFSEIYMYADMATLAIIMHIALVLFLRATSYTELKAPVVVESSSARSASFSLDSKNTMIKNLIHIGKTTATFSANGIISGEKSKTIENMKPVNTLGALVLANSILAFDTTNLLNNYRLPDQFKNQEIVTTTITEKTRSLELIKSDSTEMSGTFYASELFWSAVNNELYLKGRDVKVSFTSNKFTGSGTFAFLNKINYLVVNGTPMKVNETIKLSNRQYSLVRLSEEEAIKKYGDKGKLGAVEITLAE